MNIGGIEHLKSRDEIEKKTIEIAINEELKENRKVRIAPIRKHYDIISVGNNPEDIKYIEVKGHISLKSFMYITLSKSAFEFAKKKGDEYWIYLINIIKNKEATILKIRNPINKLEWKRIIEVERGKIKINYFSNAYKFLKNDMNKSCLKIIQLRENKESIIPKNIIEKITILSINKARKIEIEDLKALNNINNISKEEENRLKELELIRYMGGKITLTHSGIILLRLIRNQKLKEEELYELLKKEQGKIPFSSLKK
jgi:hypothetical protein